VQGELEVLRIVPVQDLNHIAVDVLDYLCGTAGFGSVAILGFIGPNEGPNFAGFHRNLVHEAPTKCRQREGGSSKFELNSQRFVPANQRDVCFATTMIYVREAEVVRDGFGSVFPPLPKALLEITPGSHEGQVSEIIASPTGRSQL
jgi:hypothetical protein